MKHIEHHETDKAHHTHDHGNDHDHHHHNSGHHHSHIHTNNKKALLISFLLITAFMVIEVIGGFITQSLALIADAGHMLSDAIALALALFAFKFGEKAASSSKTYGYRRFEIIAAFLNGITLIVISLSIIWEAFNRFSAPPEVASTGMLLIAFIGLIINIIVALVLMGGGDVKGNLNLRGAFLHVLGDLLGSVGAIAAGLLMLFFGWSIADPIASILVAVLILVSGFRVTKDSLHVLMEGNPDSIDIDEVRSQLLELPNVSHLHDLHSWSITSDFPALTVHLVVTEPADRDEILRQAKDLLKNTFNIQHSTIQIEGAQKLCDENCN
ncbi:cation diffusion facilitator family transporter [Neobacillus mesonae]|nr:cation diffusion facilitator family transporter [Neobacillus mesonae]